MKEQSYYFYFVNENNSKKLKLELDDSIKISEQTLFVAKTKIEKTISSVMNRKTILNELDFESYLLFMEEEGQTADKPQKIIQSPDGLTVYIKKAS